MKEGAARLPVSPTGPKSESLPCVQWGAHRISRLLLGHNMLKGHSHRTQELSDEMSAWHAPELGHDLELLRRADECGINTVLFGGPEMQSLIGRHKAEGGGLGWVATVYDKQGGDFEEELRVVLAVDPKPTGVLYYGGATDRRFVKGEMDAAHERLRRLRETGLLVGLCSHLPQVLDQMESAAWDVDFYMACFYTVYSDVSKGKMDLGEERFDAPDRDKMVAFIKQASKPCVAFKVLAAGLSSDSDEDLEAALRFAYENIKPVDVVGVGMWQKHTDQVEQNTRLVKEILGEGA